LNVILLLILSNIIQVIREGRDGYSDRIGGRDGYGDQIAYVNDIMITLSAKLPKPQPRNQFRISPAQGWISNTFA